MANSSMSGDSTRVEPAPSAGKPVHLTGRVERQRLAAGSKSDHLGMVLVTSQGERHVLRLLGGNPFREPALEALEGRTVTLSGHLRESFFLLDNPPDVKG
jgi:hypothetical protein